MISTFHKNIPSPTDSRGVFFSKGDWKSVIYHIIRVALKGDQIRQIRDGYYQSELRRFQILELVPVLVKLSYPIPALPPTEFSPNLANFHLSGILQSLGHLARSRMQSRELLCMGEQSATVVKNILDLTDTLPQLSKIANEFIKLLMEKIIRVSSLVPIHVSNCYKR